MKRTQPEKSRKLRAQRAVATENGHNATLGPNRAQAASQPMPLAPALSSVERMKALYQNGFT